MKSILLTCSLLFLLINLSSAQDNDSCQNATLLTVQTPGSDFTPLEQDISTSSNNTVTICSITYYYDLWYYFTATNDSQVVFVESLSSGLLPGFELASGNCGSITSITCFNSNVNLITGLTPGQNYYLRSYTQFTGYKYKLSLLDIPSNDDCGNAIPLDINRNDQPITSGKYFWTAGSDIGTNLCSPFYDYDVWFSFFAIDTFHVLYLNGQPSYFEYELLNGNCPSLNSILCGGFSNTSSAKLTGLTIGQQYYLRILSEYNNAHQLFRLSLLKPADNDNCQDAISLPVNSSFGDQSMQSGDLWMATSGPSSCNPEKDLWYTFTANASSHFIKSQGYFPASYSLYTGGCGSLNNIVCDQPVNGIIPGLNAGTLYRLRVHSQESKSQPFSISVTQSPNNDECSGAAVLQPSDNLYSEFPMSSTTWSATQSMAGCTGNADDDIWFSFTASRSSYVLEVVPENPDIFGTGFIYELFSGNCGSLASMKCDTVLPDLPDAVTGLVSGMNYYIRIYERQSGVYSHLKAGLFRNTDECEGAQPLVLTNNPEDTGEPVFNTRFATESLPGCGSTGNANDDIWFTFTATQNIHSYLISDYESSVNPAAEVFSGSCGSLASISCVSGPTGILTGLNPGSQYFIRVYSISAGSLPRFKIRVFNAPSNDEISNARELRITNSKVTGLHNQLTGGATTSLPSYCTTAPVTVTEDVWYYFVPDQNAQYLVQTSSVNQSKFIIEAFDNYDSGNGIQNYLINCGTIPQVIPVTGTLTAGDTIWFRVYPELTPYKGDFDLQVHPYPVPLINDEPSEALPLDFTNSYQYSYDSYGYTLSTVSGSCMTSAGLTDLWFRFTAPDLRASIVVADPPSMKTYLEIFSGTPGNLTSLQCSDNILNLPDILVAGQQYYLRVAHNSGSLTEKIGIFYNDTLERNKLVNIQCLGPNLIPNPSVECITCMDECPAILLTTTSELAGHYIIDDWFMATDGSADYMNSCASTLAEADAPVSYISGFGGDFKWSNIVPRNGKGYMGIFTYSASNYREYVETKLNQELIPGNKYLVSFYVNRNYNAVILMNKIGAYFSTDPLIFSLPNNPYVFENLPFTPQVAWNDSFYVQGDKWYNVAAIFTADKPYRYMTIGNFSNNSSTSIQNTGSPIPGQFSLQAAGYLNIDDVVVAEIPSVLDDSCIAAITGIDESPLSKQEKLHVYPNPVNNVLYWNLQGHPAKRMWAQIRSITGQVLFNSMVTGNYIDVSAFNSGLYFITLYDESGVMHTAKFIRQ